MQNSIDALKMNFSIIKDMGWVKSLRRGPTGIGYTFESLLGKCEDSLVIPDFDGIEIKTHRASSKSYISLFSYNPIGNTSYEVKRIFKKYGYPSIKDKSKKVLYCDIYSNYICDVGLNYKFSLRVDYISKRVYLLVFDRIGCFIEKESFWDFNTLREKLNNKLSVLAYVQANTRWKNGDEYFNYTNIHFYKLKSFETFIGLIEQGIVRVTFKVGGYIDEALDLIDSHGVRFCIKPKDLSMLYESIDSF